MEHSSEDITSSNYGKLSSSLKPGGGEYTVTDESSSSSFPKHFDIPFKGTKEMSNGPWKLLSGSNVRHISNDVSLFSTSLPVISHEKLNLNKKEHACQPIDNMSCTPNKDPLEDLEYQGSGTFLPDDEDELLSGIMDGFQIGLPNQMDDFEEYDVFGMEIESGLSNDMSKISLSEDGVGNGHYVLPNGVGTVAGEHPYGEHPSRTLFVRNINSNVEDLELRALFEQYGDIRALYTACKHRGFVMISYYDIRDARTAMKALQNKPLRRRKLDIHFSIPKDNPSDKDMNQGTLVVFNLDPSVSNDDLRLIFGAYGEVKEIRETPHKRHHKFIEFYDVRAAEAALRSLNRSDIAGKRIKLEPSRPGGARRNIMVNPSQEFEIDDSLNFRHQLSSSVASSPPGSWPQYGSPIERSSFGNPLGFGSMSPNMGNNFSGLSSLLHPRSSNSPKIAPIGNGRASQLEHKFTDLNSNHNSPFPQSHSFPEGKLDPIETLSGSQFLWGSPVPNQQRINSNPFTSNGQFQGLPYGNRPPVGTSHHLSRHHIGSAPSNVPMERHFGFFNESSERSVVNQMGFRGLGIGHNESNFGRINGHFPGNLKMMPPSRLSPVFLDNNNYFPGLRPTTGLEGFDHSWSQRVENSGNIMDNKKQFQLNLEKIINGEDKRTTLMIKNIPNKYTSKMLMAVIDENYRGTYDFLYLPIDFKNKCNVGYAFINMVSPSHIISFYKVFNGKRWEKFNSEKVASLAYARIQGKAALVAHFQNSSLMNEDKRCRPIVFHSDGSEASEQVYPPSNSLNIQVHQSYPEDSKGCPLGTSPHENPNNNS